MYDLVKCIWEEMMKSDKNIAILSDRMDSIERLLKMLVANSLLDNLNLVSSTDEKMVISEDLEEKVRRYEMTVTNIESLNGYMVVYINPSERINYRIKDYLTLNSEIINAFEYTIPVFCFDSLNGMQRKRFVEEDISFSIKEKEIHVCLKNS